MRVQARWKGKSFRKKKIHKKIEGSRKLRKVKNTFKMGDLCELKKSYWIYI